MDTATILCPYCGERLELFVDRSVRHQEYVEDCHVCCRPIVLTVARDDERPGESRVEARTEEE